MTVVYEGDDPVSFVISHNQHRRHMSQEHIAMVVAELVAMKPVGANQHQGDLQLDHPPSPRPPRMPACAENRAQKRQGRTRYRARPAAINAVKSGTVPLYKKSR